MEESAKGLASHALYRVRPMAEPGNLQELLRRLPFLWLSRQMNRPTPPRNATIRTTVPTPASTTSSINMSRLLSLPMFKQYPCNQAGLLTRINIGRGIISSDEIPCRHGRESGLAGLLFLFRVLFRGSGQLGSWFAGQRKGFFEFASHFFQTGIMDHMQTCSPSGFEVNYRGVVSFVSHSWSPGAFRQG